MPAGPSERDLLRWSEALAAIARTGLGFTDSLYERERYEEVLRVAADIRAAAGRRGSPAARIRSARQARPPAPETGAAAGLAQPGGAGAEPAEAQPPEGDAAEQWVTEWMRAVGTGVPGYVTPKVAIGAVVGNQSGELLLLRRPDSGAWLYPTGWADVGYSAAEIAVKEVAEETGIEAEPVRLIAVLDGLRLGFTRTPLYSLVFHCRAVGGSLRPHPLECAGLGWFTEANLPSPLAGAERWVHLAFAALRGEPVEVAFDPPRKPLWRSVP